MGLINFFKNEIIGFKKPIKEPKAALVRVFQYKGKTDIECFDFYGLKIMEYSGPYSHDLVDKIFSISDINTRLYIFTSVVVLYDKPLINNFNYLIFLSND